MSIPTWKDHHPIYGIWNSMKNRCNLKSYHSYHRYGGRGISYCKEWEDFYGFAVDMLPSWQPGTILDRIDNDKDYCKENCRWSNPTLSSRNRSSNVLTLSLAEKIRELYSTNRYSMRELAQMFGTSAMNVCHTIHFKQWKT